MSDRPVLIAGGGPVGILLALALAQRNIPVRLYEASDAINEAPAPPRCIRRRWK